MPARVLKATFFLLMAYWIVTIIGIGLTIILSTVYRLPSAEELGVSVARQPAYLMTVPFHPLLNLLVWPVFGWLYLRSLPPQVRVQDEALRLGIFWAVISILVDVVGWVLIPHPWRMTLKEFYVDYQPWITLVYLVIFASPMAAAYVLARGQRIRTAR